MPDDLPYCTHCGARQLTPEPRFCHRCGQPFEPASPKERQVPGLLLVLLAVLALAAVVGFALLVRGWLPPKPTATESAALASPTVELAVTALPTTATKESSLLKNTLSTESRMR